MPQAKAKVNRFTKEYGYDINNNINTKKYTLNNRVNLLQYNDEWRKMNRFSSIANNAGYIMEKPGNLTPYDWDVTFYFTYNEE